MTDNEPFDFWYAVNNTEVLRLPKRILETFGSTILNYHLLCELMDQPDKVRIREGRIEAYRPQIVTPTSLAETLLEGFGEEAGDYVDWLRHHEQQLHILKYGFMIKKQESNEHIVSDGLPAAVDRVSQSLDAKDDPFSALAVGVDQPWEVCLLKLMVDVIESSVSGNARELQSKNLFEEARLDPTGVRRRIELAFRAAQGDRSKVKALHELLQKNNLFKEYEDRFFNLVKSS